MIQGPFVVGGWLILRNTSNYKVNVIAKHFFYFYLGIYLFYFLNHLNTRTRISRTAVCVVIVAFILLLVLIVLMMMWIVTILMLFIMIKWSWWLWGFFLHWWRVKRSLDGTDPLTRLETSLYLFWLPSMLVGGSIEFFFGKGSSIYFFLLYINVKFSYIFLIGLFFSIMFFFLILDCWINWTFQS